MVLDRVMAGAAAIRPRYFQSAWVVADLKSAMLRWNAVGVGPFFHIPHVQVEGLTHRGIQTDLDFSIALAQAGPMQIELIEQHNDVPSIYRDSFAPGEAGFHHVCLLTDDFDAELARYAAEGSEAVMSGEFGGARFTYIDTRQTIGCVTEMLEEASAIRDLFARIAESSRDWDGSSGPVSLQ